MAFVAAGLILGAALAYSLYTNPEWKTFSVSRFWANFREADWVWLGLAAGAIYGSYAVRALRPPAPSTAAMRCVPFVGKSFSIRSSPMRASVICFRRRW